LKSYRAGQRRDQTGGTAGVPAATELGTGKKEDRRCDYYTIRRENLKDLDSADRIEIGSVFWNCENFFGIRIRGSVFLNSGTDPGIEEISQIYIILIFFLKFR
jgi:hypothetical protein